MSLPGLDFQLGKILGAMMQFRSFAEEGNYATRC